MSATLRSSDGQNFVVDPAILKHSALLNTVSKSILLFRDAFVILRISICVTSDAFQQVNFQYESFTEPISLPNVTGGILQLVIEWLEHHKNDPVEEIDDRAEIIIPPWDSAFFAVSLCFFSSAFGWYI